MLFSIMEVFKHYFIARVHRSKEMQFKNYICPQPAPFSHYKGEKGVHGILITAVYVSRKLRVHGW